MILAPPRKRRRGGSSTWRPSGGSWARGPRGSKTRGIEPPLSNRKPKQRSFGARVPVNPARRTRRRPSTWRPSATSSGRTRKRPWNSRIPFPRRSSKPEPDRRPRRRMGNRLRPWRKTSSHRRPGPGRKRNCSICGTSSTRPPWMTRSTTWRTTPAWPNFPEMNSKRRRPPGRNRNAPPWARNKRIFSPNRPPGPYPRNPNIRPRSPRPRSRT